MFAFWKWWPAGNWPFLFLCRTLITLTCVTGATYTGACYPQIQWRPKRWCCQKNLSFQRRRIWSSLLFSMSSSATLAPWLLCTTSPPMPLLRVAMESTGNTCPSSTAGQSHKHTYSICCFDNLWFLPLMVQISGTMCIIAPPSEALTIYIFHVSVFVGCHTCNVPSHFLFIHFTTL